MAYKDKYEFKGWKNCVYLENESFDLVATTDVGPRIIRFGFKGETNMFLVAEADAGKTGGKDWRIYGGARLWHAPEDLVRTYYPDNDTVKFSIDGSTLKLLQETESSTGLQKEMQIRPADAKNGMGDGVEIIHRIYNRNLWPVRFSVWALSVMNRNGFAIIPQEPYMDHDEARLPARPLVLWPYTDMTDSRWKWGKKFVILKQDPAISSSQKAGFLNKLGWAAYYLEGNLFIKKFSFSEEAEYPDFMSNFETYTDKNILELESLGPLKEIGPGSYSEIVENRFLFKCSLTKDEDVIEKNIRPLLEKAGI